MGLSSPNDKLGELTKKKNDPVSISFTLPKVGDGGRRRRASLKFSISRNEIDPEPY